MNHHIRTVYLVHHSHTDIGYTDLQETITARQADFIRSVVQWMQQPENQGFRWNCETLFCVERFLEQASDREVIDALAALFDDPAQGSADYLDGLSGAEILRYIQTGQKPGEGASDDGD